MFFKSTLTVPKIKDLVNSSEQKYQKIYDTLLPNGSQSTNSNSTSYTAIDLLPPSFIENDSSMKDELKSFLKKQLNNDSDNGSIFGTNNFSNL